MSEQDDPTMDYPTGSFKCAACGEIGYEDVLVITEYGLFHEDCVDEERKIARALKARIAKDKERGPKKAY